MSRWFGTLVAGCCCATLMACAAPAEPPTPSRAHPRVSLPRPAAPWDDEFAAGTELERVTVGDNDVLLPEGVRLPQRSAVVSATEVTVLLADAEPDGVIAAVKDSCDAAGYEEYAAFDDVIVWVGKGMAVRLEARDGVQLLAWAPESEKDAFAEAP